MAVTFHLFTMATGRLLLQLPAVDGSWSVARNADDDISVTVNGASQAARAARVWETATLHRTGIVAIDDGVLCAAGPITKRRTEGGKIELQAAGIWDYLDRRLLLPVAARTTPLVGANRMPNSALDSNLSGLSLGSIAAAYVASTQDWPNTPRIDTPDLVAGGNERNVRAVDMKTIASLLEALTEVENGPDIIFRPRLTDDRTAVYWSMEVGTTQHPQLGTRDATRLRWVLGADRATAWGLDVDEQGDTLVGEAWSIGGEGDDEVIAGHSYDSTLERGGLPLLQAADTGNTTVSRQSTIDAKARQLTTLGRYSASFWSMKVRSGRGSMFVLGDDYWIGDDATIDVGEREPVIPPGEYVRRIAAIGGAMGQDSYDLTFAESIA